MSARTRTHCPNCHNPYPPRAACGRVRDQITDAEMQAKTVMRPPVYVAPLASKTQVKTPRWAYFLAGFAMLWFVGAINTKPKNAPPPAAAAPLAYVPTAADRAAIAKQEAADAKFWAAKAKREAAEVSSYHTEPAQTLSENTEGYNATGYEGEARNGAQTYLSASSNQSQANHYPIGVSANSGAKTQRVSGYTRKDGTYVPAYNRRSRSK